MTPRSSRLYVRVHSPSTASVHPERCLPRSRDPSTRFDPRRGPWQLPLIPRDAFFPPRKFTVSVCCERAVFHPPLRLSISFSSGPSSLLWLRLLATLEKLRIVLCTLVIFDCNDYLLVYYTGSDTANSLRLSYILFVAEFIRNNPRMIRCHALTRGADTVRSDAVN